MAARSPSLDDITMQLERTTSQLRILSARPQIKHEADIRDAVADIQQQISTVQSSVDELRADVGALRGRTNDRLLVIEAAIYNDKMRLNNKTVTDPNRNIMGLRDTKTNERIPGFPKTAADFCRLHSKDADRIALALGWNLTGAINFATKQNFLLNQTGYGGPGM